MNSRSAKPRTADADSATATPSFEAALAELESIVEKMEAGELSLEDSLAQYRRGAELLKLCQSRLTDAQAQIKVLENDALKDFGSTD